MPPPRSVLAKRGVIRFRKNMLHISTCRTKRPAKNFFELPRCYCAEILAGRRALLAGDLSGRRALFDGDLRPAQSSTVCRRRDLVECAASRKLDPRPAQSSLKVETPRPAQSATMWRPAASAERRECVQPRYGEHSPLSKAGGPYPMKIGFVS
jgi:hypothetical protein